MKSYNGFSSEQRYRALHWLNAQYKLGARERPTSCEACGQARGIFDAHSEDYSEPFGAQTGRFGLCYRCHMMIHLRWRFPRAWDRYRERVSEGSYMTAFLGRSFQVLLSDCEDLEQGKPTLWHHGARPSVRLLDQIHDGLHDPRRRDG